MKTFDEAAEIICKKLEQKGGPDSLLVTTWHENLVAHRLKDKIINSCVNTLAILIDDFDPQILLTQMFICIEIGISLGIEMEKPNENNIQFRP
jgi:hypothetical protein